MNIELYNQTAMKCSELITRHYSTSFTLGIQTLDKRFHFPIYAIYGFVRYADEIVDTFHHHNKKELLDKFRSDTFEAIEAKISLNTILHSFQLVVNKYKIPNKLTEAFFDSMEMDLHHQQYDDTLYDEYIYGSAEVVGLMCLKVFCEGDEQEYEKLEFPARKLGSAFQKVNFLRDMKSDHEERGRVYFPGVKYTKFNKMAKRQIEKDIEADFQLAYEGILNLPKGARLGVYLAYIYYKKLFEKIKETSHKNILSTRIRIPNIVKLNLLINTYLKSKLNIL